MSGTNCPFYANSNTDEMVDKHPGTSQEQQQNFSQRNPYLYLTAYSIMIALFLFNLKNTLNAQFIKYHLISVNYL